MHLNRIANFILLNTKEQAHAKKTGNALFNSRLDGSLRSQVGFFCVPGMFFEPVIEPPAGGRREVCR